MATLPAPDAEIVGLTADAVDTIILIEVDQVDVGERLRAVDTVWAAALGEIMRRDGQNSPIEVCRLPGRSRWTLVSGAHRLEGARRADLVYLRAIEVSADRADRRMREVAENLWRRELDPVDRAAFIAELVQLKRTAAGLASVADRDARVSDRFKQRLDEEADEHLDTMATCYGWSSEVAEQIGLSGRTVRRDLMIFRGVAPSLIEALRGRRHPVASNATQLRALAKLVADDQRRVVFELLDEQNAARSVSEALARLRGSNRPLNPEAKRFSTFIGTFARMTLTEKKGALSELKPQLPAGFKLISDVHGSKPEERYRIEMIGALDAAFHLLLRLEDGEPVEDDEIASTKNKVQMALMAANSGAIPMPPRAGDWPGDGA